MGMRGNLLASGEVKEAVISAVVTRADGRVEDLGELCYWHKNPLKRWAWALRNWLKSHR